MTEIYYFALMRKDIDMLIIFKNKKVLAGLLSFLVIFACFSNTTIIYAAMAFEADTVIEAEKTTTNNAILYNSSLAASGGYYLKMNTKLIEKVSDITIPDITFNVLTNENQKYYLYLRAKAVNTSSDTISYRIKSNVWNTINLSVGSGFQWNLVDEFTATDLQTRIEINHMDLNTEFDTFFVTTQKDNVPTEQIEPELLNTQKLLHEQKKVAIVKGNGITIEAEDATYYEPLEVVHSRGASGLKAIAMRGARTNTTPSNDDTGELSFSFMAEKPGTYAIWVRFYAKDSSQDSLFLGVDNLGFVNYSIPTGDVFSWRKGASVVCKQDTVHTFKISTRERNALVDQILITPKVFTPTGRTGGLNSIPETSKISAKYQKPPLNPPVEHPRLLFRESDIAVIKENMQAEQNVAAKKKFENLLSEPTDGNQNGVFNKSILNKIEAFAFDYAINKNDKSAEIAIDAILTSLKTIDASNGGEDLTRNAGYAIYIASEVYDWCYDKLTKTQRTEIIERCEALSLLTEMGWPPIGQGAVTGHGSEAQLLRCSLAFAIATYNERPDIWEVVGGRFYEEYVPARNYFYRAHYELQGDSYGLYRSAWSSWAHTLITGMGAPAPFNTDDLYQVSYSMIYMRRPDGQLLRDGDTAIDTAGIWEYWSDRYLSYQLNSAIGNDEYLKDEYYRQNKNGATFYDGSPIMWLVLNKPEVEPKSIYNLPLSRYFGSPAGIMLARTSWEDGSASPAVVAQMKVGEVQTNNHQHLDAGHFQIYYKGILASDSGVYQGLYNNSSEGGTGYGSLHAKNYATKTIAHNSMLILDPSEGNINDTSSRANIIDGGQKSVNGAGEPTTLEKVLAGGAEVAKTEAHEIDPENPYAPFYSYIKGDLKNAYSKKVEEFKRSFIFLNLFDDKVPAAMVVFDKVTSSNPAFKKIWLLHGVEEPSVNGSTTIFRRTYKSTMTPNYYNGKLTVSTLLPETNNLSINVVGGEKDGFSNVQGIDFTGYPSASKTDEGNTWRLEVSPTGHKNTDYFLNVMFVSDNDKEYSIPVEKLETNLFYGASVADRVVYFSKSGEKVSSGFEINGNMTQTRYTICDVANGVWKIEADNTTLYKNVTQDGGVLAFEIKANNIKISPAEDKSDVAAGKKVTDKHKDIQRLYVKFDNIYTYSKPYTRLSGDSAIMPLSLMAQYFDLTVERNGDKITVSNGKITATLTENSNVYIAGNEEITLGTDVSVIDGEVMVPPRGFIEYFGGKVDWEPFARIVSISTPPKDYSLPHGYAKIKNITHDDGPVDDPNVAVNIADGDISTIWASLGTDRYVEFELEDVQNLDTVEIIFNPNKGRNAKFEIMVSENGTEYNSVLKATSDGSVETGTWEKFRFNAHKVKYIRYYARGSNISDWNAVQEIRFK